MMRALVLILLFAIAALAGLITSEFLWRSPAAREAIARVTGRGELQALVGGVAIYGDDYEARIVEENLRRLSRDEAVANVEIDRELNLLRHQFGDENEFAKAVEAAGVSEASLRENVTEHLRGRHWIEKQIASAIAVSEEECRQFYETNREQFMQPQRFRATHLFLAAPEATPPEIVAAKQKAIKALAGRIAKREPLAALVAEASEDEATKANGGDLGFFSAARVPPEFVAEIEKLRVGQISAPFQTPLGFHIAQLTDLKPPRQLTFDEARPEIQQRLLNDKRTAAVAAVAERLAFAEYVRTRR
jgi:parvulin-like peptidyl-prolyl isomerase